MNIPLGFEIGTGKRVDVPLGHTIVTGQTQKSGKTTTLEALIMRSGLRAVAFITKRGEKSFRQMTEIPPYFRERADFQFVQSLLEATLRTKMDYKEAWIMRACEGARTLEDVHERIQYFLGGEREEIRCTCTPGKNGKHRPKCLMVTREPKWLRKPAAGLNGDMYYVLNEYFNLVLPELRKLPATSTLQLRRGINVMDLSAYSFPMQALVIRSVLEYVYNEEKKVVVIIPEAWEFIPEGRRSPVRLAAEELIRKGAVLENYVWLDSQDTAGIAKVMTRQMQVWIFGVQRDAREIGRTIDSIPDFGIRDRSLASKIATLGVGEFIAAYEQHIHRVYVWPAGMEETHAQAIALGQEDAKSWKRIARALDEQEKSDPEKEAESENPAGPGDVAGVRGLPGVLEVRPDEVTQEVSEDEMWKEKYEAFCANLTAALGGTPADDAGIVVAVQKLREAHDAMANTLRYVPPLNAEKNFTKQHPASNGHHDLDAIYRYVVERAATDPAILVRLSHGRSELEVLKKRRIIEMSDESTDGRIALLIHEGFFDSPQDSGTVNKEFKRRAWFEQKTSNAALLKPLTKIAEMGFLTRDGVAYQSVKTMKVNILEGK